MAAPTAADVITQRLSHAARELGTADPIHFVGSLIQRSFPLPAGACEYGANALTPGAVPCEPSFSEDEPRVLRFNRAVGAALVARFTPRRSDSGNAPAGRAAVW